MHDGHPKVVLYGFTNMYVRFGDAGSHPVHYMGGPNFRTLLFNDLHSHIKDNFISAFIH